MKKKKPRRPYMNLCNRLTQAHDFKSMQLLEPNRKKCSRGRLTFSRALFYFKHMTVLCSKTSTNLMSMMFSKAILHFTCGNKLCFMFSFMPYVLFLHSCPVRRLRLVTHKIIRKHQPNIFITTVLFKIYGL